VSPEQSSSPPPGVAPDRPLWIREDRGTAEALDLALKILTLVYTVMAVWQVAKILNPPLQVREDMVLAAARRRLAAARGRPAELPALSSDDARAIYDATR
jgi:hypothetical protein